jgi:hypothetical protein
LAIRYAVISLRRHRNVARRDVAVARTDIAQGNCRAAGQTFAVIGGAVGMSETGVRNAVRSLG